LSEFVASDPLDGDPTTAVADELMKRIRGIVPVLSAPLVAYALVRCRARTRDDVLERVEDMLAALEAKKMPLPRRRAEVLVDDTLARFAERGLILIEESKCTITESSADVLAYYANSIAHHMISVENAASAE
jgi:glycerol-3-phosphate O-acyltransferase